MRNILNIVFLCIYLGLIIYGITEMISGIVQAGSKSMQPFLAIGLIVAGFVGVDDVIRDIGRYN